MMIAQKKKMLKIRRIRQSRLREKAVKKCLRQDVLRLRINKVSI